MGRKEQFIYFYRGMATECSNLQRLNGGHYCTELGTYITECLDKDCSYTKKISETTLEKTKHDLIDILRKRQATLKRKSEKPTFLSLTK